MSLPRSNWGASSSVESDVKTLAFGGGALVLSLVAALVFVIESTAAQLETLQGHVLPAERSTAAVLESMKDTYDRQAFLLNCEDKALLRQSDEVGFELPQESRVAAELGRVADQALLDVLDEDLGLLDAATGELERARYVSLDVDERMAAALLDTQRELQGLLVEITALQGRIQLDYVLLLRALDEEPTQAVVDQLVHGDLRHLDELAMDARFQIESLGRTIAQLAITGDRDLLNGLVSNELKQASAGARSAVQAMVEALADSPRTGMARMAQDVEQRLRSVRGRVDGGSSSLVPLRREYFAALDAMQVARDLGHRRSNSAESALLQAREAVEATVGEMQAGVHQMVQRMRVGVACLAIVGVLGCAVAVRRSLRALGELRNQNRELVGLRDGLQAANATLEDRVERRTRALAHKEASIRLLLDSTGDGLMEVAMDGRPIGECSRSIVDWFGPADALPVGYCVWDWLLTEPAARSAFEFGWEQVSEGLLPFELAADQLPNRLDRDGRTFDVEYRKTGSNSVLVIVRDWTDHLAAERAEAHTREMHGLVRLVLDDRAAFESSVEECEQLIATVAGAPDAATALPRLHMLKGVSASLGLQQLPEVCHWLESFVADEDCPPLPHHAIELREAWSASVGVVKEMLMGGERSGELAVDPAEIEVLLESVQRQVPLQDIVSLTASWALPLDRSYVERLGREAHRIARSLEKSVEIHCAAAGVRIPHAMGEAFSALTHVVRNAVDHGIESADERFAQGKPETAKLEIRVDQEGDTLVVSIEDDGAGIDRARLEEQAGEVAGSCELVDLLARSGVSTSNEVTELSGRGVGMAAVYECVSLVGGDIQVESRPGEGTRFQFRFPDALAAGS